MVALKQENGVNCLRDCRGNAVGVNGRDFLYCVMGLQRGKQTQIVKN